MPPICDPCNNDIVENDTHFHCEFCHNGNFDICQSCFGIGERCHVQCHRLFHLALQGEISTDLATVKVYYRRCRSHPRYLPLEWGNQKNTSDSINDQFPQPRHGYESLPGRNYIRLLTIEAGSGNDSLRYTPRHELLDSTHHPEYVAPSYAWGDTKDMIPSICNGKRMDIHNSLHTALRRLRPKEDADRYQVWADAICINQDDTDEKSIQVGKMWQIYQSAEQTVVWLGDAEEDTSLALEVIHGKLRRSGTALDYGQVGDVAERLAPRNLELDLNEILTVVRLFNTP
jgi:Heterokaryon incompatibility protein (HET)